MKSQSQGGAAAQPVSAILQATAQGEGDAGVLAHARSFAQPFIASQSLSSGENALQHADAVAEILRGLGASEALQAATYLVYCCEHLNKPDEVISKAFDEGLAKLAVETTRLVGVQRQARDGASADAPSAQQQTENVRKMLLAFSRDLRVVMLRLASRLQTLRHYAATKAPVPESLARESLQVFAPLANRLGIWQLKWEIEDLAFRFLEPEVYKNIAAKLDERRVEREHYVQHLREQLQANLRAQGVVAKVEGRPKHIYSIVKKMRGKSLDFEQVFDVRALRVIAPDVRDCYAALGWVHAQFEPVPEEFDDYIAKPKANGYQSLHTVVRDNSEQGKGRAIEIQIRTQAMHDHAEHGVAAHWAYKEAGAKGYAGVSASGAYDAKIAVLRQLLAWERDLSSAANQALFEDRIYVLTPDAAIVELPQGATPLDFAYSVHTSLGHRCRGARVEGQMVTLSTALQTGQTVEITAAKEGGPSRDWLNPELGFLASHRARAKVRAWFNAQHSEETIARGREAVEKLLQREGKTALKHDELAAQLGFKTADALFEVVGKDELSVKTIEMLFHPAPAPLPPDEFLLLKKSKAVEKTPRGGVLVVGVDSLLTQLAKCCKPAPPDDIRGFVTRGKGVSIHRADCSNFKQMALRSEGRVIEVAWGTPKVGKSGEAKAMYPVDVSIQASDRQGLLRDISEVFAKEKMNVVGVQTQSVKDTAWMTFTVEVADSARLTQVLALVASVKGVRSAQRR
jgi:GTP pyrophosphokinase